MTMWHVKIPVPMRIRMHNDLSEIQDREHIDNKNIKYNTLYLYTRILFRSVHIYL